MSFDPLFNIAIEHGDRIGEAMRSAWQRQPTPVLIALFPLKARAAGKTFGEFALIGGKNVDGEDAKACQSRVTRRRAVDAHDQGRRLGGQGGDGHRGQTSPLLARAERYEADAACELTHGVAESLVGGFGHARTRRARLKAVDGGREHRLALIDAKSSTI